MKNHPRIELFLNQGISYLEERWKKSRQEYYDIIGILWDHFLEDIFKYKIFEYKQDWRVIKLCENIFDRFNLEYLAKYPNEFEKIFYSVVWWVDASEKNTFQEYYNSVLEWFSWELWELEVSSQFESAILEHVKLFRNDDFEKRIILEILMEVGDFSKIQKFVRAYQSLVNHSFYEVEGKVFSRFSYELFSKYASNTGKILDNKEAFFKKIWAWYQHIFKFIEWKNNEVFEMRNKIKSNMSWRDIDISDTEIEEHVPAPKYNPEYISILRHSYDWYVRIVPEEIINLSPVTTWAWGYTFVSCIYDACWKSYQSKKYDQISFMERNEYLMSQGEKYTYKVSYPAEFAFDDLLVDYDYIDPHLFFSELTLTQEERLMKKWLKMRDSEIRRRWR